MSLIAITILLFEAASTFVLGGTLGKPPLQYNTTIVGGYNASIENFPYQVAVYTGGQDFENYFCGGGSIITEYYVLTTDLCVYDEELEKTYIRAGHTLRDKGTIITVAEFIIHNITYVAFLKTKDPIKFTSVIKPIKLPPRSRILKGGSTITVSGWGQNENLQAIDLPVVNFHVCKLLIFLVDFEFCAGGFPKGGKGMCWQDYGNAAVQDGILVGYLLANYPCVHPYMPDVYIDIAHPVVRDFITELTGL